MNKIDWSQLGNLFKKNLKNDGRYIAWRLASIGTVGFLGLVVIFTIYFIYNNIYNTLSNINVVFALSNNPQNDIIDMKAYEQAKNIVAKKQQTTPLPDKLRNIFYYDQELPNK